HVAWIAAEVCDVIAHPLERRYDVEHPHIARRREALATNARQVAVAEGAQPVVDRAEDDVAEARKVLAVVAVVLDAVSVGEAATVNPEHHRTLAAVVDRRCEHVDPQTVLAYIVVVPMIAERAKLVGVAIVHVLRRRVAPPERRIDVGPWFWFLWRHETIRARRIRTIRQAEKVVDVSQDVAARLSFGCVHECDVITDTQD